jgi:hypothetical protein
MGECDDLARPEDGGHFSLLTDRYGYLRKFAPAFLAALDFQSNHSSSPLLAAIAVLRRLNAAGRRGVPRDATLSFVPDRWRPHVVDDDGRIDRPAYELCVLWQLRAALRSGDVWLARSRRYADPESYLIPKDRWPSIRAKVCAQTGAAGDFEHINPYGK